MTLTNRERREILTGIQAHVADLLANLASETRGVNIDAETLEQEFVDQSVADACEAIDESIREYPDEDDFYESN